MQNMFLGWSLKVLQSFHLVGLSKRRGYSQLGHSKSMLPCVSGSHIMKSAGNCELAKGLLWMKKPPCTLLGKLFGSLLHAAIMRWMAFLHSSDNGAELDPSRKMQRVMTPTYRWELQLQKTNILRSANQQGLLNSMCITFPRSILIIWLLVIN